LWRRHSGGRAMPWGEGFVGLSLVLPRRAALVASDPLALAPEQVMNRYVRGILEACELSGVPALYPGRDVITVQRRILALASFEVEASGALVFEAVIANGRDFSVLPGLLDRADPEGVVKAGMLTGEDTTSLARQLGRALDAAEVADRLRRGYERRLGVSFRERTLALDADLDAAGWLGQRRLPPHLNRHASAATQLGVLEAHLALAGGRIEDAMLAGDFIANSPAASAPAGRPSSARRPRRSRRSPHAASRSTRSSAPLSPRRSRAGAGARPSRSRSRATRPRRRSPCCSRRSAPTTGICAGRRR